MICGSQRAAWQARSLGLPEGRIMQVSGMVLNPKFYQPRDADRGRHQRAAGELRNLVPRKPMFVGGFTSLDSSSDAGHGPRGGAETDLEVGIAAHGLAHRPRRHRRVYRLAGNRGPRGSARVGGVDRSLWRVDSASGDPQPPARRWVDRVFYTGDNGMARALSAIWRDTPWTLGAIAGADQTFSSPAASQAA